ncbi:hypothetical protein CHS0354_040848 [Potamilus streckersoni]|uniref:Transcriptional adapter 3-like n=1 Tax=Potamilus streckersoni TaxID=2493646 RepID=A0AAE0SLD8_9BIVA|nr:hypothetical protein CHS0354_040848 [Potamilus streckersoni]
MKGKGKAIADKDCPLQFPDLQPVDHIKQSPKYTAILSRSEEDGIGLEELDSVQSDLETLLAAAGKRLKLLENEIQILVNWQEKKDIKPLETPISGKRSKVADDRPSKKFKEEKSAGKVSGGTPVGPGRPKSKNTTQLSQVSKVHDYDIVDSPTIDLSKLPKNSAVNRFWASVEPYCAEISNEDLKLLEDILKSHEDDSDFYKIPPLGQHYAERWAEEDMFEEQKDGAKISDRRRGPNNNNNNSVLSPSEATTLLRKAEQSNRDESPFGPLTQRLVSALIEENIMTPMDDAMAEIAGGKESVEEAPAISPRALAKQLNLGNPSHLEKRIKRELEEQGILDFEDKVEEDPNDEILLELRRKQQDLKAVSQHNIAITKRLYKLAKEDMARQEIKKKLQAADAEVMEAYRKIQLAKQKKKPPTKKEREAAQRALKEREQIVKALDL